MPSLNDVPVHTIVPHSLVRIRGMVQDMYDPEYYMDIFEQRDASGASVRANQFDFYVQ